MSRLSYLRRVLAAYLLPGSSQLSFWHEKPELNGQAQPGELGEYWQAFREKADYAGPFDPQGIPLLDYRGSLGQQYNPIAIAQYGLGNLNQHLRTRDPERLRKACLVGDWLREHLEINPAGFAVWNHHFDWDYRTRLTAPWFSALAQGQGLSLLVRLHHVTGEAAYLDAAWKAFEVFLHPVDQGGVLHLDPQGRTWLEEYLVSPPTHILNGFIWAAWGVYDLALATSDPRPRKVFDEALHTLREALPSYDLGYWSLYEHSGTWLRMIASPFYHRLHIVQLRVLHRLTGESFFVDTAERWERYQTNPWNRARAWIHKVCFKLCYY